MIVYYSQEDKRWASLPYTRRGDPTQTIGSSACGPTSFAMVASTFGNRAVLPPEAAAFAVTNGYRTTDNGTAWSYFAAASKEYGLEIKQSGNLLEARQALTAGALVIAVMGPGHLTGGGHYVLMTKISGEWISINDPNHDNTKYGRDGLVRQGIKDDGKIEAHTSVFEREARQYWIFNQPPKEDETMTKEEQKAFSALQASVKKQSESLVELERRLAAAEKLLTMEGPPSWASEAVSNALHAKLIDSPFGGSYDFYRILTVLQRKGLL
ncbi:C39 family peptidase [Cohnella sp. GCM10020058]|uniref:C39 family peptidase n=1 Tax=Cohnella sp. GCM10020058 TaxID=3317330 RepID=UPI0036423554